MVLLKRFTSSSYMVALTDFSGTVDGNANISPRAVSWSSMAVLFVAVLTIWPAATATVHVSPKSPLALYVLVATRFALLYYLLWPLFLWFAAKCLSRKATFAETYRLTSVLAVVASVSAIVNAVIVRSSGRSAEAVSDLLAVPGPHLFFRDGSLLEYFLFGFNLVQVAGLVYLAALLQREYKTSRLVAGAVTLGGAIVCNLIAAFTYG